MNNLSTLLDAFQKLDSFQRLQHCVQENFPTGSLSLPRAVRTPALATIAREAPGPLLYVLNRNDQLLTFKEEIQVWFPQLQILTFPEPNPVFYEQAMWGPRTRQERISTLSFLSSSRQPGYAQEKHRSHPTVILTTTKALMTRSLALRHFIANSRWIKTGATLRMDRLLQLLVQTGYQPARLVTEPGEFSHRGGILDVWPPAEATPVRIDYFGDEIDTLRLFDPATQRSMDQISTYRLSPAREGLPRYYKEDWDQILPQADNLSELRTNLYEFFLPWMNPTPSGIISYLPDDALVLFDDRVGFSDAIHDLETEAVRTRQEKEAQGELPADFPLPYLTITDLEDMLGRVQSIDFGMPGSNPDETIRLDSH